MCLFEVFGPAPPVFRSCCQRPRAMPNWPTISLVWSYGETCELLLSRVRQMPCLLYSSWRRTLAAVTVRAHAKLARHGMEKPGRSCFSRVRQMPCLLHSYFLFAAISSCDLCDSEWHTGSVSDLAGAWPGSQTAGSQSWRVQGTQFPPNLLKSRIRGISQQKVGHTPQQNHTPRPRLLVPDTSDIIGGAARLLPPLPFLRTTSTCCSLCHL